MKKILLLTSLLFSTVAFAQKISNNILGHYVANADSLMYGYFEFDGNGKVDIAGYGKGDYFIKGDSLIVYPDKSIFKFIVKGNSLLGTSEWVKGGAWIKKDTVVANNRKDEALAQKRAHLLNEYYILTQKKNELVVFEGEEAMKQRQSDLTVLCEKGLPKACLDLLGLMMLKDMGGIGEVLNASKKGLKPFAGKPETIALGHKIIDMGEPEGHTVLGAYYQLLGDQAKAKAEWQKGIDKGSEKSAMAILQLELAE